MPIISEYGRECNRQSSENRAKSIKIDRFDVETTKGHRPPEPRLAADKPSRTVRFYRVVFFVSFFFFFFLFFSFFFVRFSFGFVWLFFCLLFFYFSFFSFYVWTPPVRRGGDSLSTGFTGFVYFFYLVFSFFHFFFVLSG